MYGASMNIGALSLMSSISICRFELMDETFGFPKSVTVNVRL